MSGKSNSGAISVGNGQFDDLKDVVGNPRAFMTENLDKSNFYVYKLSNKMTSNFFKKLEQYIEINFSVSFGIKM